MAPKGFLGGFFAPFTREGRPQGQPDEFGYVDPMEGLGPIDRYKYLNKYQPEVLMSLAAGLLQGTDQGMGEGFAAAGQEMQQNRVLGQKRADLMETRNATRDWLKSRFPDASEEEIHAAMLNPDIMKAMLKQAGLGDDAPKVYGNIVWGRDIKTGKQGMGAHDTNGVFHIIETPGFEPSPGTKQVETETEIITYNVNDGTIIARQPKDLQKAITEKAIAEAKVQLKVMEAAMPGLTATTNELKVLAKKATYTAGGQLWNEVTKQLGAEPSEAMVARTEFENYVNITMLPQIRQFLGPAFTSDENEMVRSLMGNVDYTPAEKLAVIDNFMKQKIRQIQAKAAEAAPTEGGEEETVPTYDPNTRRVTP